MRSREGGGLLSRLKETGPTNRTTIRSTNESKHFGSGEGIFDQTRRGRRAKEREREGGRERERERERDIHTHIHPHVCDLENEGDSSVSDGRTYRPGTKETRGASMVSSTPDISLIRLGTRFECSLSLSTTSFLSKSVRARSSMRNFRTVWHTWVAITRVPYESTRELVVGSELARGSFAYGHRDCS